MSSDKVSLPPPPPPRLSITVEGETAKPIKSGSSPKEEPQGQVATGKVAAFASNVLSVPSSGKPAPPPPPPIGSAVQHPGGEASLTGLVKSILPPPPPPSPLSKTSSPLLSSPSSSAEQKSIDTLHEVQSDLDLLNDKLDEIPKILNPKYFENDKNEFQKFKSLINEIRELEKDFNAVFKGLENQLNTIKTNKEILNFNKGDSQAFSSYYEKTTKSYMETNTKFKSAFINLEELAKLEPSLEEDQPLASNPLEGPTDTGEEILDMIGKRLKPEDLPQEYLLTTPESRLVEKNYEKNLKSIEDEIAAHQASRNSPGVQPSTSPPKTYFTEKESPPNELAELSLECQNLKATIESFKNTLDINPNIKKQIETLEKDLEAINSQIGSILRDSANPPNFGS